MPGKASHMRKMIQSAWAKVLGVAAVLAVLAVGGRLVLAQPGGDGGIIVEVRIVGNRIIETGEIMRYIRVRAGMVYNKSAVFEDAFRLTESKKFKDVKPVVRPLNNGWQVTFEIYEFPNLVQEVIFRHAKHISQKDLDEMTRDIKKGLPMNPASNKAAAREIQQFLKNGKGRYWANVTLEEGAELTDRRVIFNISEGPVLRVRSTQFVGGESLAYAARLRTQIMTSRAILGLGGTYNEPQTDGDVKKLEDYFHANGYTNAKVFRELIFTQDYSMVDVIFHIKEGVRAKVDAVNITPNPMFSDPELRGLLRLKPGDWYNEAAAKQDQKFLEAYIGYRGLKPTVQLETTDSGSGLVTVEHTVNQPPEPSRVGMIYITGNDVTQDRVILRLLNLYPGQTLRYPELELGKAALMRSNLFEMKDEASKPSVEVKQSPLDDNGVYQDILVRVKETQTGSFMVGAGVNSNTGLMGNIVLNERNFDLFRVPTTLADVWDGKAFRGAGEEFRLEASPGLYVQRYSATFREPYLCDQPYSLTTSAYYFERFYYEDIEERLGGRFTLAHTLDNTWPDFFASLFDGPILSFLKEQRYALSVNAGIRLEDVCISGLTIPGAPIDYTSVYGHSLVVGPKVGAVYDTRDSFLRPTAGGIVDASVETDFGSYIYQLASLTASRYFTLWQRQDGSGKQVLALKSQLGWASSNTPEFDRYFAGGYGTIRGFQFRGVGPNVANYEVGGDFMWLNSIEYQIPVLANDQLYFVAFVDSGTVESSTEIHNYRLAAGVGMRLAIPMLGPMPLALDIGMPLIRGPNDHIEYIAFSVGFFH